MTQETMVKLAAVVTTLAETDGGPESTLYMGLGMDMGVWTTIRGVLVSGGLATSSAHYMRLTPKGVKLADQLNAALPKR